MSNSAQDRIDKDIQPTRAKPWDWDYRQGGIVDNAKIKLSDETAKIKHSWDYEPRAVTDDAMSKLSEVEIMLDKWLRKPNYNYEDGRVNQVGYCVLTIRRV